MQGSEELCAVDVAATPADYLARAITRLLPAIEIASCVLLSGLLLWKGVLPGWHALRTDFPNYYLVARLLREGYSLDRIYDWVWLQRIKDHWGLDQPLVGFAGLTPFSAFPIVPLSFFSALTAKRLWILINLLLLGSSVELLKQVTSLGRRRLWLLTLLAVFPLRTSFLLGQMHLLVLFLFVLAYFFDRNKKQVAAAVCLAIAGMLKVYPLLFAVYYLWKRRWRAASAMLGAVLLFLGISYAWMGTDAINFHLTQVLPRSAQGEVLDPYSPHAASLAALFHTLFLFEPTLNPAPLLRSPSLYAVLYPLCQLLILAPLLALLHAQGARPGSEKLEWAAYLFSLLVLSPVPASYHFVVLILPMILLVDFLVVRRQYGTAMLATGMYCAVSIVDFLPLGKQVSSGAFAAFGRLWLELVLLAVMCFCLWQNRARVRPKPLSLQRIACFCAVAGAAWTAAAISYHRHFQLLEQDIAARIPAAAGVYLSTGVRHTLNGYLFTAMEGDGYRVLDGGGRPVWQNASSDQLSVAVAKDAPGVLMEVADKTGSSLVVVRPDQPPAPLLADAESPAISSDGVSLAFIREVKGRGALWFARLRQPSGTLWSGPTLLTDQSYDVRDVSFATPDWLLFTAKVDGRLSIFSVHPGSQPRVFLSDGVDVESPAVSRDARLVAFTKLVRGRWQLGYLDVATGHERLLTFGDCNAYSPTWIAPATVAYATDCGRGLGLTALASVDIGQR